MSDVPKGPSPTTNAPKAPALNVDDMRNQQSQLAGVMGQIAAKSGALGSIPFEILMPVSVAMAQWEIAIQLALRNERDAAPKVTP